MLGARGHGMGKLLGGSAEKPLKSGVDVLISDGG